MAKGTTAAVADPTAEDQDTEQPKADRKPMYGDATKMLGLLERCQQNARANTARQARDRADLENLKMNRGGEANQWIVWDGSANTYVERPYDGAAGLPQWFPRPTSNFLATQIDGVSAVLNQSQAPRNWYPTRDDDKSRATADVCEIADPVLLDEIDYPHSLRPRLNKLCALTNAAAIVLTYDNDPKWGMEELPILQCAQCQEYVDPQDAPNEEDPCPSCGGGPLDFAVHPRSNMPITQPYPKGKLDAELVTSFELSIPKEASSAHEDKLPWVSTHSRWQIEDAMSRFPKLTKRLAHDRAGKSGGGKATEQLYADNLRNLSAPVGDQRSMQTANGGSAVGPVIWRLWHDPIDDDDFYFPEGLYLVALDGEDLVLESSPLPFKDDEDRPFKNVMIRQWTQSPGSAWGKPPADDLVPLQKQLNLAQALAFLILMHHASPRTFVPSTVTLLDKMSGVPGATIGYRALTPGDKPLVEPGVGFPEALKWFLEFIISTFDKVSKLNAVLMGQRPEGDPTLGEVEILQERGMAAFQEPLEQLVDFEKRLSLKLLHITRECGWSERYRRILGDNGEWKLQAFTGADLEGHVTVDIDIAMAYPKSPLLTNMRVTKAFELGILNPLDPEVQEQYLKLNDLMDFKKSTDVDNEQIARELDVWKQATAPEQIAPPNPAKMRLDYHLFRKTNFLKTEEFERIEHDNPPVAQAMLMHVQQLQMLLQPAAPPEETDPAKGEKGALEGAIQSGAVKPKAGPGAGGALKTAVTAGAVQPAGANAAARKQHGPNVSDLVRVGAITPKAAPPAKPGARA